MNPGVSKTPSRDDAYALMCQYTKSEALRQHMLAVETAVKAYAIKFKAEHENAAAENAINVEHWAITGLLHDFDYERWPNPPDHPLQGSMILSQLGYPADIIYAIKSHADYLEDCPRVSLLDKTLYACDELAGFIVAVTKVRPGGIKGMQAKSVRKKLKQKSFAAAVNRDDVTRGAEDLGVELNIHIQFVIDAMTADAAVLGLG